MSANDNNPPAANSDHPQRHMLRTYQKLRIGIACVTLIFLFTLTYHRNVVHNDEQPLQNSISAYYHQNNGDWRMRDWFVFALGTVGVMLVVYRGRNDFESGAMTLAGSALIGVAAFPMDPPNEERSLRSVTEVLHYICAVVFFSCLAFVSLTQTRASLEETTRGRLARARAFRVVYWGIGAAMILLPALSFALYFFGRETYVYWAEFTGVGVFLVYWVAKTAEWRAIVSGETEAVKIEPTPPSTRAQWVAANSAIVTAIAALFGVYSFYAASERERVKAAEEAVARIYPMDAEVKRSQKENSVLRPLLRSDPDGLLWNAHKTDPVTWTQFCGVCSDYGNLFEYYLLVRKSIQPHPKGKQITTAWDMYLKDISRTSYGFRGYIQSNRGVWTKMFLDEFDAATKDLPAADKKDFDAPPPAKKP